MLACTFLSRNPDGLEAASQTLVEIAFSFSPRVQLVGRRAVLFDLAGSQSLFGAPERIAALIAARIAEAGIKANVAIARTFSAALCAAAGFDRPMVIPHGEEARLLSTLPLSLLSLIEEDFSDAAAIAELEETWRRWGLKTFGELAALPGPSVAERLGQRGMRLHRIVRGVEDPPLMPLAPAPEFVAVQELEYPLELLDPLSFILAGLLNKICASLEARGQAASEIHLRLRLETPGEKAPADFVRVLRLPVPLCNGVALLKLLRLDLEAHPPHAPVTGVSLRAEAAAPRYIQNHLFVPPAPEPARLELTLARLGKLIGEENAGSAALLDTHQPGVFEMRPFGVIQPPASKTRAQKLAAQPHQAANRPNAGAPVGERRTALTLRLFRPPLFAEVECLHGRPARLWARGIRGEIVALAGPWRTTGGWWRRDPWMRDEWDVEIKPFSQPFAGPLAEMPDREAAPRALFLVSKTAAQSTALYRIHRDLNSGSWYIDGSFD